jgi:HPt (histidine-containing phosphotransfer) domain-containing protein
MSSIGEKQAAMRDKIAVLAQRFLQRCAGDMATGRVLLDKLRNGNAGAFKDMEQLAHRIMGTGSSLGFHSLSAHAVSVERLAEAQPSDAPPDPEAIARLGEYLAQLESEIDLLVQARR